MGAALVGNNFSPIPLKIPFHIKKKWLVAARYLQSIKTFLTVEVSQYSKSGSTFSSSEPVAQSDYRYNHSQVQGPHMWPSPGPWPDSQCSKTVEVGYSC